MSPASHSRNLRGKALAVIAGTVIVVAGSTIGYRQVTGGGSGPTVADWYVSPTGNNTTGTSWTTAWTNTSSINWTSVQTGDTIALDGGSSRCTISPYDYSGGSNDPGVTCGQNYAGFTVGDNGVTIFRSQESGRNGTVVIYGGRSTPLPDCAQSTYSANANGGTVGIEMNGHSGVTIDGMNRSGIIIRGFGGNNIYASGVRMRGGGTDTLRNMEIFDNGSFVSGASGYHTDGNAVETGGQNNVYDRLLLHDNGQDQFHSDGSEYNAAGSSISNTWAGALRSNPSANWEPFNDMQVANPSLASYCTHADAWQTFAPSNTTMTGLTFDYTVFGPGVNQGLYPSDSSTITKFNNVTVSNSVFLGAVSQNTNSEGEPVHGWVIDNSTIIGTPDNNFELPVDGANTMTDTIKFNGGVTIPCTGGSCPWTTSNNDYWLSTTLPGSPLHEDPSFTSVPTGSHPSVASLMSANWTTSNSNVSTMGAPIHTMADLYARIDSLNGGY